MRTLLLPRAALGACMCCAQAFFLWMFFSSAGLERLADAGGVLSPDAAGGGELAYRYAAEWRHGLAGIWPVYVPGFIAVAVAGWFWALGRGLRELICEGLFHLTAALAAALALAPAGASLMLADFTRETGVPVAAPAPGVAIQAVGVGVFTLIAWNVVVLSIHRALWRRSWRPLLLPAAFDAVLIVARPFTFGDLVQLWAARVLAGHALAIAWAAAIPLLAAILVWRQFAWERRGLAPSAPQKLYIDSPSA